jgi:hypothetical protein
MDDQTGGDGVPEEIIETDQVHTKPNDLAKIVIDPKYLTDCAVDHLEITQPSVNRAPTAPILDEQIQKLTELSKWIDAEDP